MPSPGKLLQEERLKCHRTLSEVAKETCISTRYLEAIEDGELEVLPGDFFYKSFIKQYAQALKLDKETTDAILAAVEPTQVTDPLPRLTMAYEAVKEADRSAGWYRPRTRVALALLATVLIACSGLYAIWYRAQVQNEFIGESAASQPQPAATAAIAEPKPADLPATRQGPAVPAPEKETAAVPPETTEISRSTVAPEPGKIQVDLAATEKTWVSLSSHGKTVFSGVLGPEQTKNFAVSEQAKLMTGNAAGLDVRWNGKPIGPIGARGEVRTVLLTADTYQILPPRGL